MAVRTNRFAMIEQFLADGMTKMFGNPGTVEQGFLDALDQYPDLKYILTLQESVAVMAADGHARATRQPTLVQIHSTPGLGNAIGAIYQANRGHSPLVIIGGDAGVSYLSMNAQMAGDLVAFAAPVTKWSAMVTHPSSLLRMVRRALKIACTPPMGPVYLCLPMDILDAECTEEVRPTSRPSTQVRPTDDFIRQAAAVIAAAAKPTFYVGDGVAYSGASAELERLAEVAGADVWDVDSGEINISYQHPLYRGMTGHMFGYHSLPITQSGDVNFICGTYMMPEVFPELGDIYALGSQVIHVDLNANEIAKNHRVDHGVVADPKLSMALLADELERTMTAQQKEAAAQRSKSAQTAKAEAQKTEKAKDAAPSSGNALRMADFVQQLVPHLSSDTIIFDEALTSSPALSRYIEPTRTGQYFMTRGGSLGVGIPGAIGAKLAFPEKPVWGFTGDGGSMYTIQALWTAARHNLDVKFVVCNNGSYHLLQLNIDAYWKERNLEPHAYPVCFDLSNPAIQFDQMAKAMGVDSVRVETLEQIPDAISRALNHKGPFLIDLVLEGSNDPARVGNTCGQ